MPSLCTGVHQIPLVQPATFPATVFAWEGLPGAWLVVLCHVAHLLTDLPSPPPPLTLSPHCLKGLAEPLLRSSWPASRPLRNIALCPFHVSPPPPPAPDSRLLGARQAPLSPSPTGVSGLRPTVPPGPTGMWGVGEPVLTHLAALVGKGSAPPPACAHHPVEQHLKHPAPRAALGLDRREWHSLPVAPRQPQAKVAYAPTAASSGHVSSATRQTTAEKQTHAVSNAGNCHVQPGKLSGFLLSTNLPVPPPPGLGPLLPCVQTGLPLKNGLRT